MKYKLIYFYVLLFFSLSLVISAPGDLDQEEVDQLVDELATSNEISDLMLEKVGDFDSAQRDQVTEKVKNLDDGKRSEFWKNWKGLSGADKNKFMDAFSSEQREVMLNELGKEYGLGEGGFAGFGSDDIAFSAGNVIGNSQGYLDLDNIKEYNDAQKNVDDKITKISFSRTEDGTQSIVFEKNDRSQLDLTVGSEERGFYFDAVTGKIWRTGKESGLPDGDDPLSGTWNGNGVMKVSATGGETKLSFDAVRGEDGSVINSENFAKFVNSRGESFSPFQHPIKGEDGKSTGESEIKPAEVTFDSEDRVSHLENIYKGVDGKGKQWGGFFGEDTDVTYSAEDYDAAEGTALLIDEESGTLKSKGVRKAAGPGQDAFEALTKISNDLLRGAEGLEGLKTYEEARDAYFGLPEDASTYEKFKASAEYNTKKVIADKLISDKLGEIGVSVDSSHHDLLVDIVRDNGPQLSLLLDHSGEFSGASANILDSMITRFDSPLVRDNLALDPSVRLNLETNFEFAKGLKQVEMTAGNLDVFDSRGTRIPIIDKATPYGYLLPGDLNEKRPSFGRSGEINFVLNSEFRGEKAQLQIYNNPSGLQIKPLSDVKLESVNGKFVVNAGGGITHSGVLGFGSGREGSYQNVIKADFGADPEQIAAANEYMKTSNARYNELYDKYLNNAPTGNELSTSDGKNVWTKAEVAELNQFKQTQFTEYYNILGEGDYELSLQSSKLRNADLGNSLRKAAAAGDSSYDFGNSDLNLMLENAARNYYNDVQGQGLSAQQGIDSLSAAQQKMSSQLNDFAGFLDRNRGSTLTIRKSDSQTFVTAGSQQFVLDPAMAPHITDMVVMAANSGGINQNGDFYLNPSTSRFGSTIGVYVNGGHYGGAFGGLRAKNNAGNIRATISSTAERQVQAQLQNPASGSRSTVQSSTYNSYTSRSTSTQTRTTQTTSTTTTRTYRPRIQRSRYSGIRRSSCYSCRRR